VRITLSTKHENVSNTLSALCEALKMLGYVDCYHGFDVLFRERLQDMKLWQAACEAKFEGIGKPYTKAQWDNLLGHCQVENII
jgi:hypothetical protein